ncbi:hypothetical protein RJ55_02559 [Drechmeria coniospora]|nr:hypothetical protein RJ55_02559 [Drechmeria coniospora]
MMPLGVYAVWLPMRELTRPKSSESSSADVNAAVEELLSSLSDKFASISSEIFAKMDEMSRRIDGLESALQQRQSPDSGATKPPQ